MRYCFLFLLMMVCCGAYAQMPDGRFDSKPGREILDQYHTQATLMYTTAGLITCAGFSRGTETRPYLIMAGGFATVGLYAQLHALNIIKPNTMVKVGVQNYGVGIAWKF